MKPLYIGVDLGTSSVKLSFTSFNTAKILSAKSIPE